MDIELILSIANFLLDVGFILALLMVTTFVIAALVCSGIYERNYKKAVINVIMSNSSKKDTELVECIKNEYINYQKSKINSFSYLKIDAINSKLISELRNEKYKKYFNSQKVKNNDIANKLERINKIIREELTFEDDISQIINCIQSLSVTKCDENKLNKIVDDIKIKFSSCIMFCDGRIYEKDIKISDLESKLKKNKIGKFFSWVGWVIGMISGIVTIYSWIK